MKPSPAFAGFVFVALLVIAGIGLLWGPMPPRVEAQGANYRFAVSSYGGPISTSPAFATLSECNAARNELNQGWPMSQCRFSSQ